MYTRCPHCGITYQISAGQLRNGRGEAICCHCNMIFGALENLGDSIEEALADRTTCLLELPQLDRHSAVAMAPDTSPPAAPPMETPAMPSAPEPNLFTPTPDETPEPSPSSNASLYWSGGAAVLVLLLVMQLFIFERDRLAQNANLRPLLQRACHWFGCTLPPFRNLADIEAVDRSLYPARNAIDGYEFHLVIVNQAPYPQPYPLLKLSLTALDGTPIAQRIFKPEEYLHDPTPPMMPSHRMIFIHLDLAAPERAVGGFQFEFVQ